LIPVLDVEAAAQQADLRPDQRQLAETGESFALRPYRTALRRRFIELTTRLTADRDVYRIATVAMLKGRTITIIAAC
jgi:hypothetical protein